MIDIIIAKIETASLTKAGHMIEMGVLIGTIRISEEGTMLEMIGTEVYIINTIEET